MRIKMLAVFIFFSLFFPSFVRAEKNHSNRFIGVQAQSHRNRHSVSISFDSLKNVKHISYIFSYDSDSGPNGVVGNIDVKGNKKFNREFLCGTCSSGVCRYHGHVRNGKLEVTIQDSYGREYTHNYSIQI